MNRLFVTSLKSIGLVSEGDNPEADVVIWKAHGESDPDAASLDRRIAAANQLFGPSTDNTETNTETLDLDQRIARLTRSLKDLNQRIARLKEKRKVRLANLANIPKNERNPMIEKETPQDIDELVMAKLDSFARRSQFEGEMKGAWGHESTPREAMVTKIKARWWETPDGRAVKDLLRERARERSRPASLVAIQKSHSEAYAAIGRLDG